MADVATGLAALKTAFDIVKDMRGATAAYTDAEFRLKISDLYLALSEARSELASAQVEISDLQNELRELKTKMKSVDELIYRDGFFYREQEIPGKSNGPFCPKCFQGPNKSIVQVNQASGIHTHFGNMHCPVCGSHF